jgi:flagellar hook-associated protein 3 FlgL
MTRIADFAQHQRLMGNVLDGLARIRELQAQASSGKKAQDYPSIAGDTNRLLVSELQLGRIQQYIENTTRAQQRLDAMDQALGTMVEVAIDLRTMLIQATSATSGPDVPVAENARNMLDIIVRELNTKLDGRYLFSGSRTQTPSIGQPVPDPAIFGVPDAGYYQGDGIELTVRADDDLTQAYGVTGDRLGFQQIVGALKAAIEGDVAGIPGLLDSAIDLAKAAIDELTNYRAEVGAKQVTLATVNVRHQDFTLFVENVISDVEDVDVILAVTQLAQQQTVLEASFITLSRLAGLSLTNFLR